MGGKYVDFKRSLDVYIEKIDKGYSVNADFQGSRRSNMYNCFYNIIDNHYVLFESEGNTQKDISKVFGVKDGGINALKEVDDLLYLKAKKVAKKELLSIRCLQIVDNTKDKK